MQTVFYIGAASDMIAFCPDISVNFTRRIIQNEEGVKWNRFECTIEAWSWTAVDFPLRSFGYNCSFSCVIEDSLQSVKTNLKLESLQTHINFGQYRNGVVVVPEQNNTLTYYKSTIAKLIFGFFSLFRCCFIFVGPFRNSIYAINYKRRR